jgi:hypothetical protein
LCGAGRHARRRLAGAEQQRPGGTRSGREVVADQSSRLDRGQRGGEDLQQVPPRRGQCRIGGTGRRTQ